MKRNISILTLGVSGWLVVFYAPRQRSHIETAPHLLSLAKDVKLGLYTIPTGNRTPGNRVAFHYATTAPHQRHFSSQAHA